MQGDSVVLQLIAGHLSCAFRLLYKHISSYSLSKEHRDLALVSSTDQVACLEDSRLPYIFSGETPQVIEEADVLSPGAGKQILVV